MDILNQNGRLII